MNQSASSSAVIEEEILENEEDSDNILRNIDLHDPINDIQLSQLEDDGFDKNSGNSWIFPRNYEKRQYQYNISKAALFKNTLVVLPTGLGKTFIASVIIYNIFRWFPRSKIIFMAPTRPLVAQQIDACYSVVGIPATETCELTGKLTKTVRAGLWKSKKLFFCTPQVIVSDLQDPEFPATEIKLIVVDEAHKAKGKYAYCEVIKSINERNQNFRVLALSATPGRKTEDIIEIIQNLLIAHIEIRTDNSIDVAPYTFKKKIETVVVKLGELQEVRNKFVSILDPYVRKLGTFNVISGNLGNLSKGWLILEQIRYNKNIQSTGRHPKHGEIVKSFSILISLYQALELLERHGVQLFLRYFKDSNNVTDMKYYVGTDKELKRFLEELDEQYKGTSPLDVCNLTLPNGQLPPPSVALFNYGHPKYDILKAKLMEYFELGRDGAKAIIFCEFRDTVTMVYTLLLQNRPLIEPRCLIGQGGTQAVSQKEQIAVMKDFREGNVNTLITTSVCEEGIDVGSVDLVVCFDINSKNPTRFVQRIGRTGRARQGKVIMLASEGKELSMIQDVLNSKDKLNNHIANNRDIKNCMYRSSKRLVPSSFNPECLESFFKIPEIVAQEGSAKKKKAVTRSNTIGIRKHFFTVNAQAPAHVDDDIDVPLDLPAPVEIKKTTEEEMKKAEEAFYCQLIKIFGSLENVKKLLNVKSLLHSKDVQQLKIIKETKVNGEIDDEFVEQVRSTMKELSSKESPGEEEVEEPLPEEQSQQQPLFIENESRYGNTSSFSSPFMNCQQMNKVLNATGSSTATPKKRLTPGKSIKSLKESPLVRAFERSALKLVVSSTPVTSKSTNDAIPSTSRTNVDNLSIKKVCEVKETLKAFGLNSIDDIFADYDDDSFVPASEIITPEVTSKFVPSVVETSSHTEDVIESSQPFESFMFKRRIYGSNKGNPPKKQKLDDLWNLDDIFSDNDESMKDLDQGGLLEVQTWSQKSPDFVHLSQKENVAETISTTPVTVQKKRPNFAKLLSSKKSPIPVPLPTPKILSPKTNNITSFNSPKSSRIVDLTKYCFNSQAPTANNEMHIKSPIAATQSPIGIFLGGRNTVNVIDSSEEDEEDTSFEIAQESLKIKKTIAQKKKRRAAIAFIDAEAGASGDDSTEEDDHDDLDGFVAHTQHSIHDETGIDMQAKYLQSLRSPQVRNGGFKIPRKLPTPTFPIYSQVPHNDDDEYDSEMDSFIVDNCDETIPEEEDELEIAEAILKAKRKAKKTAIKRRKVLRPTDSSDEDDNLKDLRNQLSSNPD
ncbi:unnamed protein product [Diamesa tonsa]